MGDGSVAVLGGMICCTGWRIIAILVYAWFVLLVMDNLRY